MPFGLLRGFMRERNPVERCELCGAELLDQHDHLFEPVSRQLVCACPECQVSTTGPHGITYLQLSRRICYLAGFKLSDALWDSLMIPVGMAFFFYNTPAGRMIAFYPSPAGATESLLSLEAWEELASENPVLLGMQPDVEAFLVNRLNDAGDYYLVPLDKCYELVGLIRIHWRGFSGGPAVWQEIERFYAGLKAQAQPVGEKSGG
jgi:hypothetical protein